MLCAEKETQKQEARKKKTLREKHKNTSTKEGHKHREDPTLGEVVRDALNVHIVEVGVAAAKCGGACSACVEVRE